MLPITPWLHAMNVEAGLPQWPPTARHPSGVGLRRAVGRSLIALGRAVAGTESASAQQVSVAR